MSEPGSRPLTAKQRRFVAEYLVDGNATEAATRAGYSKRTAGQIGYQLLQKTSIQAAVEAGRAQLEERLLAKRTQIALELQRCGFANMADYMTVDKDGLPRLDFSKLTRDQAAALSEVTVDTYWDGAGDYAREVKRVKFKLVDKRGALVDLAKLLGHYVEKHKLEVSLYELLGGIEDKFADGRG